jgi:ABC-type phosphate transport system substrate-binding protein
VWANRIEFPLNFQSVKSGCPIGAAEERTVGNEIIASAFSSWQSAMCEEKTVFGFSQVGDTEARGQIISDLDGASRFAVVSNPLTAEEATGYTLAYGPVAQSAIVIAYNIEYDVRGQSSLIGLNGRPVTSLVLNQRLLAKLLTQSYKQDVPGGANPNSVPSSNPAHIGLDEEFLELNPDFLEFQDNAGPAGILQPIGNADVFRQLWQWIIADDDAAAFLDGTADDWGMVVNNYYRNLDIPDDTSLESLPKADLSTYLAPDAGQAYGTFELRPYASDLHDAGLRTRRADAGTKVVWDPSRTPPAFVSSGPQSPGSRFIFGITDMATAVRLKLPMAKLMNDTGSAVEPTETSISTAIASFGESTIPGVSTFDASIDVAGAYPLATVAYAAVNVCDATISQLTKYNKLLNRVKGEGQVLGSNRGQLPEGYVPLTADQTSSLSSMIKTIAAEIKSPVCPEHAEATATTTGFETPTDTVSPLTTDVVTEATQNQLSGSFQGDPNPALKYSLLSALFFGAPFMVGGRMLARKANVTND